MPFELRFVDAHLYNPKPSEAILSHPKALRPSSNRLQLGLQDSRAGFPLQAELSGLRRAPFVEIQEGAQVSENVFALAIWPTI